MELATIGRAIYPGTRIYLWCNPREDFTIDTSQEKRFRLVLFEKGAGIININGRRILFHAPAVFCLSETEKAFLETGNGISAKSVYFCPHTINSALSFENIRDDAEKFSGTVRNDRTCLSPFFTRDGRFRGKLSLSPAAAKKMSQLFDILKKELEEQPDNYWPCRSRSYFLELLFIVERIYLNPESDNGLPDIRSDVMLDDDPGEMDQVLLYLHSNYGRKITISELTRAFSMNRTTLNKKFNELVGMPVIKYLLGLRIRLSALILRDTMVPVSEIVERVGFNDISHFNRMFRKLMGCSPSEYRKVNCWLLH